MPPNLRGKMFSKEDARLAVLEEKLNMYEELSREMLARLETAVSEISKANINISQILTKHETRLDQSDREVGNTQELIKEIRKNHEKLEEKINQLTKFRWMAVGIVTFAAIVIQSTHFFGPLLTVGSTSGRLPEVNNKVNGPN
jgi:lipid II:glycine glycyltransferase (peptidoglycan interpeptide bridge formation enzyme)